MSGDAADDGEDAGAGLDGGDDDAIGSLEAAVEDLHAELAATAERPVERTASRWIGEAEAVAGDAATAGLDPDVVRERVGHVADLLENVDGTGDDEANRHVERARELAAAVLRGTDGEK